MKHIGCALRTVASKCAGMFALENVWCAERTLWFGSEGGL